MYNMDSADYLEMDPSGRYGRFGETLGKGATKTVYRAYDEELGTEVAWYQVKLNELCRSPDELHRLYSEVHLLKTLNHPSIMHFYTSWIDVHRQSFNFIGEMFSSGSLREYRQKYKRVNIRAIKRWARQILEGLAYLHSHDPQVIHRDLKCDNIFVNGNLGQVKIGDLGLAATLSGSKHAHSVIGTPEFMAPELYEEEYTELVDIYSFGMCMLEMLTSEFPYSECSNPAQIYKKVTSGKLPKAFYKIADVRAQEFVRKCLDIASKRPSADELLMDPFLVLDEDKWPVIPDHEDAPLASLLSRIASPSDDKHKSSSPPPVTARKNTKMMITGTMNPDDDTIFLKVQISDKSGQARNIYFPYDITSDTALDVASEMVKELEIVDWDSTEIAEMIDEEISALLPNWKESNVFQNLHHQQHSFIYHDDDNDKDGITRHPFYSPSSHNSSHASLPGLFTSPYDWPQGDLLMNGDDTSSQSSLASYIYSNINYVENDVDLQSCNRGELDIIASQQKKCSSRMSQQSCCKNQGHSSSTTSYGTSINRNQKTLPRIGSLVDVRSQLLHRTLVNEINKRRLFNTVGAVENIGFHEPKEFCSRHLTADSVFSGRSSK